MPKAAKAKRGVRGGSGFRRSSSADGAQTSADAESRRALGTLKNAPVAAAAAAEAIASSTSSDAATKSTKPDDDARQQQQQESQLSRGQRKRLAKRNQYLRREQLVMNSLKLQREEEQRKRIDGLDAIRDALLATVGSTATSRTATTTAAPPPKSNRGRRKLVQKETSQMNLVLQHPAFQADPLATIREHLKNTVGTDEITERRKREADAKSAERELERERKKQLKKELSKGSSYNESRRGGGPRRLGGGAGRQQQRKRKAANKCRPTRSKSRR